MCKDIPYPPLFKRTFVTTTDADMFDISNKKYAFEWLEYCLYSKNTNQSIIKINIKINII